MVFSPSTELVVTQGRGMITSAWLEGVKEAEQACPGRGSGRRLEERRFPLDVRKTKSP